MAPTYAAAANAVAANSRFYALKHQAKVVEEAMNKSTNRLQTLTKQYGDAQRSLDDVISARVELREVQRNLEDAPALIKRLKAVAQTCRSAMPSRDNAEGQKATHMLKTVRAITIEFLNNTSQYVRWEEPLRHAIGVTLLKPDSSTTLNTMQTVMGSDTQLAWVMPEVFERAQILHSSLKSTNSEFEKVRQQLRAEQERTASLQAQLDAANHSSLISTNGELERVQQQLCTEQERTASLTAQLNAISATRTNANDDGGRYPSGRRDTAPTHISAQPPPSNSVGQPFGDGQRPHIAASSGDESSPGDSRTRQRSPGVETSSVGDQQHRSHDSRQDGQPADLRGSLRATDFEGVASSTAHGQRAMETTPPAPSKPALSTTAVTSKTAAASTTAATLKRKYEFTSTMDEVYGLLDVLDSNGLVTAAASLPWQLKSAFNTHLALCTDRADSYKTLTARAQSNLCGQRSINKAGKDKAELVLPADHACRSCTDDKRLCIRKKQKTSRGYIVPLDPALRGDATWDDIAYWVKPDEVF